MISLFVAEAAEIEPLMETLNTSEPVNLGSDTFKFIKVNEFTFDVVKNNRSLGSLHVIVTGVGMHKMAYALAYHASLLRQYARMERSTVITYGTCGYIPGNSHVYKKAPMEIGEIFSIRKSYCLNADTSCLGYPLGTIPGSATNGKLKKSPWLCREAVCVTSSEFVTSKSLDKNKTLISVLSAKEIVVADMELYGLVSCYEASAGSSLYAFKGVTDFVGNTEPSLYRENTRVAGERFKNILLRNYDKF